MRVENVHTKDGIGQVMSKLYVKMAMNVNVWKLSVPVGGATKPLPPSLSLWHSLLCIGQVGCLFSDNIYD